MKRKIRRNNEAVTPVQSGPGTNRVIQNLLDFMNTQGIKTIGNVDKVTLEAVLADSLKRGEPIKTINNKVMITMESIKLPRRK